MRRIRVPHDQRCERVRFHLAEQVQSVEALQVVEAVAVLQALHLVLEHELEGRAQHAAEGHDFFGEATDPQIDRIEATERTARIGTGGVEEVEPILFVKRGYWPQHVETDIIDQNLDCVPLPPICWISILSPCPTRAAAIGAVWNITSTEPPLTGETPMSADANTVPSSATRRATPL